MDAFEAASEFHKVFAPVESSSPHALTKNEALKRAHFMMEELVEYVAATTNDSAEFKQNCEYLKQSIDLAEQKILANDNVKSGIVPQSDALIDLIYFAFGTFVKMNTDPRPLIDIVHQSNMHKRFPDGSIRRDPVTNKILKPKEWYEHFAPEHRLEEEIQKQVKEFEHDKSSDF